MKKYLFTSLFIVAFLVSCGKNDSLTNTDLLTKGPWILTTSTYSPPYPTNIGTIVDYYAVMPAYIRDDLFYYYSSGTYVNMEGASKYSPNNPDVWEMGVWSFNDSETKLYKGIIDYVNEYEILKLDGSQLQTRMYFADSLSNIYSITETYAHP